MSTGKAYLLIAAGLGVLAFAAGFGFYFTQQDSETESPAIEGFLWPDPRSLGSFSAVDQDGREFGEDRLMGQWSFLFFGYSHCPDICPVTLSVLKQFYEGIEQSGEAENVQVIFVSVDPERDTPERLREYVHYFNPDFIGVSGSTEQIADLAGKAGIVYMRGEQTSSGNYLVDHTASILLVDPRGRLVSIYSAPHDPVTMRERFDRIRDFLTRGNQ